MPDFLLFAMGVVVTAVVGFAVWSVGLMDVDDGGPSGSGRRDPREQARP